MGVMGAVKDSDYEEEPRRGLADKIPLDIDQMIINEPDAKQRAFLIVLNSINQSLLANTSTVRDISNKLETHLDNFETHVANEDAIMNRGRGAWKVMAWVLGIAQLVGVSLWIQIRGEFTAIDGILKTAHSEHAAYEVRLKNLEERK